MSIAKWICLKLIRGYQLILSPWIGRQCRYIPTCSNYATEAIERYGAIRGCYLTLRRLLRCHPFGGHGLDPVPQKFSWRCHCVNRDGDSQHANCQRLFDFKR